MALVTYDTDTGEVVSNNDLYNEIVGIANSMIMPDGTIDRQYYGVMKDRLKAEMKVSILKSCLQSLLL